MNIKSNRWIYWISTVWLASAMIASGVQQIIHIGGFVEIMDRLGYPVYFSFILGAWKIPGIIVLLIPKVPMLKEWAYAGFIFIMSGAVFSHLAAGDPWNELFPASLLLILTAISWYFRPESRKIMTRTQT